MFFASKSSLQRSQNFVGYFALVVLGLASSLAHAGKGSSLMQTAPVLEPGQFEVKAQADVVFNNGGGFNISPHFRAGVLEHFLDVEGFFGTGTTDFQIGGLAKYNLLPDVEGQVGLSFLGGLSFLRDEGLNATMLTFGALVSKDIKVDFGTVSPYGAFEFESFMGSGDTVFPLTLVAGARWDLPKQAPWLFYSELSMDINDSNWGLSAGAGYRF
jgi:hypothetical protein